MEDAINDLEEQTPKAVAYERCVTAPIHGWLVYMQTDKTIEWCYLWTDKMVDWCSR
jgi:hypothetical protein